MAPIRTLIILFFLTIGTGIGGALIINRQLYRGGFFSGGEVGYIPFARHGKEGFWEDFGSTGAMIRYYREVASVDKDTKVNGKTILKGVNEGDSYAIKAFDEHMEVLGTGLAGIICILNPEKIIIGGGISESGSFYIESLRASVQKHTAKECLGQVVLEAASLGNKAGFLGASYLALEALDNVQD
jgi:glucokinase